MGVNQSCLLLAWSLGGNQSADKHRMVPPFLFINMKKLLYLLTLTTLCLNLTSCGGDDEDNGGVVSPATNNTQNGNNQQTLSDPEGTVVINMTSGSSNNFYDIGLDDVKIHIDANNNFETSIVTKNEYTRLRGYVDYDYYVEFASLGKTNSLNDITSYPATGWSKSLIVMPGTGYVARIMKKDQESTSDAYFNGRYTRLYVVEQNTMTGTIVKYQTPFEIPFSLEKKTVELSHYYSDHYITGTTRTVKIINGTRDIKVAEQPEWCYVSITSEGNVSISAGKNPDPQPRSGTVVLKNAVCSASIVVTQDVAPEEE